jgi:hypothetical protein
MSKKKKNSSNYFAADKNKLINGSSEEANITIKKRMPP